MRLSRLYARWPNTVVGTVFAWSKTPIPQAGDPPQAPRHAAATAAAGPVATRWRRHHGCGRPHLTGCRWAVPSAGRRGGRRGIAGCRDDRQAWALAREGGVRCGRHGWRDGCNRQRRSGGRHGPGIGGEGAARSSTHRRRRCRGGAWRPRRPGHLSWSDHTLSGSSAAIGFRRLRVCKVDVVHTRRYNAGRRSIHAEDQAIHQASSQS